MTRLVHFAKFREMQNMIFRKIFREKWVRKIAKMNTADFDPFRVLIVSKIGLIWEILRHENVPIYRPGQANCKFQLSMLLMKNPQFWYNLSQIFRDWPHLGWVNPWKFEQNQTNMVNFSLKALKVEICN